MTLEQTPFHFRIATEADHDPIWNILQAAIIRRKNDGSTQWQDGYPNPVTVQNDIQHHQGFVLTEKEDVVAYCSLMFNNEPNYESIEGAWLSTEEFCAVHRVAVAENMLGKGIATTLMLKVEDFVSQKKIPSIKVDTNFDNIAMLQVLAKLGYTYCGQVYIGNSTRKAFEKLLF